MTEILVYADWEGFEGPCPLGTLHGTRARGKEIFAFEYSEGWLQREDRESFDPELQLFAGRQYPPQERS